MQTVIHLTPLNSGNPYYDMFDEPLSEHEYQIEHSTDMAVVRKRIAYSDRPPIIHAHQLDPYYHHRLPLVSYCKALFVSRRLQQFKTLGAPLVYTYHDPLPGDRKLLSLDKQLMNVLVDVVDRVVVLGQNAATEGARIFGDSRVRVVPHPNLINVYGPPIDRAEARSVLGWPDDSFVALSFGGIRPYKGHEFIVEAFRSADLPCSAKLYIVGRAKDRQYLQHVRSLADASDGRIVVIDRPVPSTEVALWYGATDYTVFGFEKMFASGSVLLSLSYGIPVLAPAVGCIPEYVGPAGGSLFPANDVGALVELLERACGTPKKRGPAVTSTVSQFSLPAVAARLASVYDEIVPDVGR